MAGTPHGLVNALIPSTQLTADAHRTAFAIIAAFFDHLCTAGGGNYMTRIASYWGDGGALGWDYTGGTNPAGENAFGLWKMNTSVARPGGGFQIGEVYAFLAWADALSSDGWKLNDSTGDGVGLVFAFREDGGNPWNLGGGATQNNDGSDTKGSPLWTAGASTVHVMERSCNPGGDNATNKDNTRYAGIADKGANAIDWYLHCFADADNIAIVGGTSASEPLNFMYHLFGLYDPITNVGTASYPAFALIDSAAPVSDDLAYGGTSGAGTSGGALVTPSETDVDTYIGWLTHVMDADHQPNAESSGGVVYDESPIYIYSSNAWCGWLDEGFVRAAHNLQAESYDSTNQRVAIGTVNTNETKLTFPWPSSIGEDPGATRTMDGVTF